MLLLYNARRKCFKKRRKMQNTVHCTGWTCGLLNVTQDMWPRTDVIPVCDLGIVIAEGLRHRGIAMVSHYDRLEMQRSNVNYTSEFVCPAALCVIHLKQPHVACINSVQLSAIVITSVIVVKRVYRDKTANHWWAFGCN